LRSGSFSENPDGTFDFYDYGQGVLFIPSGLAYYANAQPGIPEYSPLIFSLSLFTLKASDHDGDGVFSKDEDIDGDGNPFNDDTDGDGTADMYDADDDGDGVLTRDELDLDENGIPGDSDSDGIPNYLDSDSA
jgi:FKBP-type peptidyl-prolyl cis-trans isomerase FkpA